ncbi:ornithine cyclodeaminase [Variovorax sp. J22P168]|uniref:ornithine cyclodeaminase n=1 Tax=Variovorax jilinensis TaxID=3053513 RepID=UPI0025776D91|nr:ornithine cyclodeaminase [Variovorax sp. J22P168]MDM0014177.1 ornithine cyclodeaminase [Variovorax sp. J22P168]
MQNRPASSTLHLGARDVACLVARKGLAACIAEVAQRIGQDFMRWPAFDKCARIASHSKDGVIELMPIADPTLYAFKYVNGHPSNPRSGLPTVMAFGLLADVATGAPLLLAEMALATAIRTAATSALAARALARRDSRSMALIGNGAQSEFQAVAFHQMLGIRTLRLFDTDTGATARLLRNLQPWRAQGLETIVCGSTAEAVRGADIVTTATADKRLATILAPEMIEAGMHLNAIGGDCPGKTELHAQVLRDAAVFVEYAPQTRIEGELQQLPPDSPATELWRVLRGDHPGRRDAAQVTVFDSVGFALEDYSTLCFLQAAALEFGIGERLQLVPRMADPKDLFGLIADASERAPAAPVLAHEAAMA